MLRALWIRRVRLAVVVFFAALFVEVIVPHTWLSSLAYGLSGIALIVLLGALAMRIARWAWRTEPRAPIG